MSTFLRTSLAVLVFFGGMSAAGADTIYWTDQAEDGTRAILRADLDTFEVEPVIPNGLPGGARIAIDPVGGKMYWTTGRTSTGSEVYRANLDGSEMEAIAVFGGTVGTIGIGLDPAAGQVYWTRGYEMWRANLDGTDPTLFLYTDYSQDLTLDLVNGKVYVSIWDGWPGSYGKVQRANLDGTGLEDFITDIRYGPIGLAADGDAGHLYWTKNHVDLNLGRVLRKNIDGSGGATVISEVDPEALLLDLPAGKVYWTTWDYEGPPWTIQRCNLDGSEFETLPVDTVLPGGIAILPTTEVPCPGDLDGDNDVDLADLAELLGHYGLTEGATYEDGDLDGDGDVDLADLADLLGVYGTTCE